MVTLNTATPRNLAYMLSLQRRWTDHVGFLPAPAMIDAIERRQVTLARINGDVVGYILTRRNLASTPCVRPILQACVQLDAQRLEVGTALVSHVAKLAALDARRLVTLWCRSSIPAMSFWRAVGMRPIATRPGGSSRGGTVTLWTMQTGELTPGDVLLQHPAKRRGRAYEVTPLLPAKCG